jgi:hypothetical protein
MGLVNKEDVASLLEDEHLVGEIIEQILGNKEFASMLAKDAAAVIAEELDKDENFKKKMLKVANTDKLFRKEVVDRIVEEIS